MTDKLAAQAPGNLVFYRTEGEISAGVGLEATRKGVVVSTEDGQRKRVDFRDLVTVAAVRSGAPAQEGFTLANEILKAEAALDLDTVWELTVEEQVEGLTLDELVDLAGSGPSDTAVHSVILALDRPGSRFKKRGDRWAPLSRKVVEEKLLQAKRVREKHVAREAVLTELRQLLDASLALGSESKETRGALATLRQCALEPAAPPAAGTSILARLFPGETRPYPLLAFELMVRLGIWDEHEDLNLVKLDASDEFPAEALVEAELVRKGLPEAMADRLDLGELFTVAIDDEDTVEVDDALAVERTAAGLDVHVFIADAAAGVRRGSALDAEAARRASTIYHPGGRVPMLPYELSADALSLQEGEKRPALDHRFSFDESLSLFDYKITPCVVTIDRRLTYEQADALLDDKDSPEGRSLGALWEVAEHLFEARVRRGAITFFPVEFKVRVAHGEVAIKRIDTFSTSRRLVAEFMVNTGERTGTLLFEKRVPLIFRNQPAPDDDIHWELELARDPVFVHTTIRKMRRAEVTLQPGRHAGLGLESYCQVTSPLRRYGDLLMQRQVHAVLTTGVPAYGEGELLEAMAMAEQSSVLIRKAVAASERYWKLVALKEQELSETSATVMAVQRNRAVVHLDEFGVTGRYFYTNTVPEPGASVMLTVVHVEPRTDNLVLQETG